MYLISVLPSGVLGHGDGVSFCVEDSQRLMGFVALFRLPLVCLLLLSPSRPFLSISGASSEDEGTYACFAVEKSGRIHSRALWEEVRRESVPARALDLRLVPLFADVEGKLRSSFADRCVLS